MVKKVQKLSSIPVIGHLEGICHTYIDKYANINMAKKILVNAKLRNTSICGATETLLIHKKNSKFIKEILNVLVEKGVLFMQIIKLRKFIKKKQEMHQIVYGRKNSYHQKFLLN